MSYVLDAAVHSAEGKKLRTLRSKFDLTSVCQCFGVGHLRGGRVTSWPQVKNASLPVYVNPPYSFAEAGTHSTIFVELYFHANDSTGLNEECRRRAAEQRVFGELLEVRKATKAVLRCILRGD